MAKDVTLIKFPLGTTEEKLNVTHVDELALLDWKPFESAYPVAFSADPSVFTLTDSLPEPRNNTYVLNAKSLEVKDGKVNLATNLTNYRSLMALKRVLPKMDRTDARRIAIESNVLPFGTNAFIETSDGYVSIEERGKVENPGRFQPAPAGGVEALHLPRRPSFYEIISEENWEEAGLKPHEYNNGRLIGIIKDSFDTLNPNMQWHFRTDYTWDQFLEKAREAPEAKEHTRLMPLRLEERSVIKHLVENQGRYVAHGIGEILMLGNILFDNANPNNSWLKEAEKELAPFGWNFTHATKLGGDYVKA